MMKSGRIPALDGVRGISILLVLFCHAVIFDPRWASTLVNKVGLESGRVGVSLFFVLSGFLITRVLISAEKPDLRSFYADRFWRIVPACYAYVLVIGLLGWAGYLRFTKSDLIGSLTFTRNFMGRGDQTGHLWSIAVEAHFYALWALLVSRFPRRVGTMACVGFLLSLVARYVGYHDFGHSQANGKLYTWTPYRMDAVLAGSLLAVAKFRGWQSELARSAGWLAPAAVVGWLTAKHAVPSTEVWINSVIAPLLAVFVAWAMEVEGPAGWVLGSRAARLLAALSYSLYLWQQLFLCPIKAERFHALFPSWASPLLTLGAATASYLLIEQPFLGWHKRQRSPRHTKRAPDAAIGPLATGLIDCALGLLLWLGFMILLYRFGIMGEPYVPSVYGSAPMP